MEQDVDAFLEYLSKERNHSQNTLAAYRNDLTQLAAFIQAERPKGKLSSNKEFLLSYLLSLREKRYSLATIARKVASAKSLFKFMVDSGRLKENPLRNLASPQIAKRHPKLLSLAECRLLLAEPAKLSTLEAKRDKVMLELLYATGLRVSELMFLNVKDIDLERCHVYCSYGSSKREVPFEHRISQLLRNYINNDRLDLLYNEREDALFLNRRGGRLTRQGFWQIVKNYASQAGLGAKITPHTLRHSFAAHKLQSGAELQSVQRLLGHAYVSSTRIYEQTRFAQR